MSKKPNIGSILKGAALVSFLVLLVILLVHRSIEKSVYSERQSMLKIVTSTSATVFNQYVETQWDNQEFYTGIINRDLPQSGSLEEFIESTNGVKGTGTDHYFFVDTEGKFYSSHGSYGKINQLSYYSKDTDDRLVYLSKLPGHSEEETFIIFRTRLENPIEVETSHGRAAIAFFAYAYDFEPVRKILNKQFTDNTNTFIYDSNGIMLYRKFGIKILLDGYNIFPKFAQSHRRFGEDPEELIAASKAREDIAVELTIAGERFYFCSSPIELMDWSLAFIVKESFFTEDKGSSFAGVIIGVTAIAVILGLSLIILMYTGMSRKSAEEKLKSKTEFLSNMSHDIRTPINGIMGMTNIAKNSIGDSARVQDCLNKIDGASHHLLSLVNDVLDMSRIESGKTDIVVKPSDIIAVCENCHSIIKGQIQSRDLEFLTEFDVENPKVLVDELHLRQVFINILGNAIKFTPDGGKIWFKCKETGHTADTASFLFQFKDTGIGMSREFQKRLFEAFSQEDAKGRSTYVGTGLGMAITKQLVDLMGGTIDVESATDQGTTFTLKLTFARDLSAPVEEVEKETAIRSIEGVKVLLVEDNELNQEIATELLSCSGAVTDTASDGEEAISKFSGQPEGTYDIILMDIMMPKMNGLDATRAIRALDRPDARTIPILAMTANAFEDDVQATKDAGMNAHLSKPIDMKEVIRAISTYVKK